MNMYLNMQYKLKEVDNVLPIIQKIIGLELTRTGRAADMELFIFGEKLINKQSSINKYKTVTVNVGQFSLHVQCHWRIIKNDKLIVGSDELYCTPKDGMKIPKSYQYQKYNNNLRDIKIDKLLQKINFKIKEVNVNLFGDLIIKFGNGYNLQTFSANASGFKYSELWRLVDRSNGKEPSQHLVCDSNGYSIINN